jgi:hypothetical protein
LRLRASSSQCRICLIGLAIPQIQLMPGIQLTPFFCAFFAGSKGLAMDFTDVIFMRGALFIAGAAVILSPSAVCHLIFCGNINDLVRDDA